MTQNKTPNDPHPFRLLVISGAGWLALGLAMTVALYADSLKTKRPRALQVLAQDYLPYLVPFVVFSWLLAWWLSRHGAALRSPRAVWRSWLVSLLAFVPLNAVFNALYTSWWQKRDLAQWWQQIGGYNNWTDAMVATGTFAALVAWVSWRERRQQETRWLRSQAQIQRLRLQLLQGQLEPHFLFNALNSVSALVRSGDRGMALSSLSQVSDLLRYALRASRVERVSLAEEMQFAQQYLEVQRLRFGPALVLRWEVSVSGLDEAICPPLLVQPLIENAVRHGLEAQDGSGFVSVALEFLSDDRVQVRIENNVGTGDPVGGHGVGLQSTHDRLRLLFGERAGLSTWRSADVFVACLIFPCRESIE